MTVAAMGGTYEFAKIASANLREKDDSWNPAIGGFLAGSIMGLKCPLPGAVNAGLLADLYLVRTMPAVLGYGAGLAVILGAYDYTGGTLRGYDKDPNVDEYERKQYLRKNRRRPIQETLEELGEGRGGWLGAQTDVYIWEGANQFIGIYGPGYEERRRERIKQRYGIEVPASPS